MEYSEKLKLSTFDAKTTQKNDYRKPPFNPYRKERWLNDRSERIKSYNSPPPKAMCHETLTALRPNTYIPFNLCWDHRPIVEPPEPKCEAPKARVDTRKDEVIGTRPRLYVCPAVSMDDVPDKKTRDMMVHYMYTTDFKRAMKQTQDYVQEMIKKKLPGGCTEKDKIEIPCGTSDLEDIRLSIETSEIPALCGKIRKKFDDFDKKQERKICTPSEHFWNDRPKTISTVGKDPLAGLVSQETVNEISDLIENNQLRIAHDKPIQGYEGYKPLIAQGVTFKQSQFPNEHPMLSMYQVEFCRRK